MGGSRTSEKIKEIGSWRRMVRKLTGRRKEKVKNDRLNNTKPSNDLLGELKIAKSQLFPPNMVENIFRAIASSDENRLETSALTPSAVFAVTTVSQLQEPIFWGTLSRCRTLKAMEDHNGEKRLLKEALEEHCRLGRGRSPFLTLHTELISAFAEAKSRAMHNPNMRLYILAVDLKKLGAEDYVSIAHLHRVLRHSLGYDNSTMIVHGESFQKKSSRMG
ncbi:hypothetical protein BS50DRAFT_584463 [Corynespora cassiicola Philippines]|uniref:Uncharacterized protein n=1 Tax=Corynespora cassiicola Philippines TaxID=1448308 RepID=A0A2T2NZQ0_CORCC|nr:hypothetical protein BS50DRAFT_584463 [Corynespora cassiicola Philippines]